MINPANVLTYDQLFAENLRLKAELDTAKLLVLEANMQVVRARNLLLAQGQLKAHGLQPVNWPEQLAGGAV